MQILLFSILACKVKQNAPRCHTYLEIINARYGRLAHKIFLAFAFVSPINIENSELFIDTYRLQTSLLVASCY